MHTAMSLGLALAAAATMMTCDGGPASTPDAGKVRCAADSECSLVSTTCCAPCGNLSADQVTAVHTDQLEAHRESVCGTSGPVVCDACLPSFEGWEAFCNGAEQCDVRAHTDP